jgi:hypothetical protein
MFKSRKVRKHKTLFAKKRNKKHFKESETWMQIVIKMERKQGAL